MDKAAQVASGLNLNLEALKEPRGFIKFIEFIIAIFAFATTCGFSGQMTFTVACSSTDKKDIDFPFGYPFDISSHTFKVPICNATVQEDRHAYTGSIKSSAEFYVFVGVMAFLYSIGAVILYVVFDDKYRKYDMIPIVDFIVSAVFAVLWLISSAAWAQGVTDVKYYTGSTELFQSIITDCFGPAKVQCTEKSGANWASLNVSLIFGFLNMAVWGGNLWFLFKETKWFKVQAKPPAQSPSEEPQKV